MYIFGSDKVCIYCVQIDVMGQSLFDYTHPCDHDEVRDMMATRTTNNQPRHAFLRFKCTLTPKGRSVNLKSATYKVSSPRPSHPLKHYATRSFLHFFPHSLCFILFLILHSLELFGLIFLLLHPVWTKSILLTPYFPSDLILFHFISNLLTSSLPHGSSNFSRLRSCHHSSLTLSSFTLLTLTPRIHFPSDLNSLFPYLIIFKIFVAPHPFLTLQDQFLTSLCFSC